MNIIRKLILKEWFRFFAGAVIALFLLISVANLISGFLRGNVTALEVVINHFIEIPDYLNKIFPVSCLMASLFSINKLKTRSELTAIFAAGYSRKNYIIDLTLASLLVTFIQFATTSFVGPFVKSHRETFIQGSSHKFRNLRSQGLKSSTIGSGKMWYKSDDYFISFTNYDSVKKEIFNVSLYRLSVDSYLEEIETINKVSYQNGLWVSDKQSSLKKLNQKSFPKIENLSKIPVNINETPDDLSQIEADITILNIFNLWQYIKQLQSSGINISEYMVLFYDKFSNSIICIIFTILASVSIFNPNRRSSSFGNNIALVFFFTILYWLIYSYLLELGNNAKLSPLVATFSVPALFTVLLIIIFSKNRKLAG
ncbi:LptF/LptG family permease [Halobacteriovorax sp. HLS]|uniref:LptF/LptG family permease n=1 Tax=Halobacteriovorax sp. HLS TaxID=2234000 RepID=UPI000FD7A180|nr:LptF/LptG family permease [Halobacteriovorax sp. HLS]